MAVNYTETLAVPASATTGAATNVSALGPKTVFIQGSFTGTFQTQISADGTNWHNEGSAFTAAGTLFIEKPCNYVRFNCTAFTSSSATAHVVGTYSTKAG